MQKPKARKRVAASRRKPRDRRQLIIDGAISCFIKNGVVGTTFKQIAKEAGVHQPLIAYYFPTFEDLLRAIVEIMLADLKQQSMDAIDTNSNDPRSALQAYVRAPMMWSKKKPEYNALWTFFYHLASYLPQFRELNDSIRKTGRERISLLLYKFQEAEKLRLDPSWTMERLAWAIHTQITGAAIHTVTESCDPEEVSTLCESAVSAILDSAFSK